MGDLICFWASLLGSGTERCIAWYGWWRWVSFCTTGFWDWDWDWELGIMGNWHRWHRDMDRIIIQVPFVLSGNFTGVGIHIRYHGSLGQGLYYVGVVMEEPPAALAGHNKLIVLIIFSLDPWSTCSIVCASYSFSFFLVF